MHVSLHLTMQAITFPRCSSIDHSGRSTCRRLVHVEAAVMADDGDADTSDDDLLVNPTDAAEGRHQYTKTVVKVS